MDQLLRTPPRRVSSGSSATESENGKLVDAINRLILRKKRAFATCSQIKLFCHNSTWAQRAWRRSRWLKKVNNTDDERSEIMIWDYFVMEMKAAFPDFLAESFGRPQSVLRELRGAIFGIVLRLETQFNWQTEINPYCRIAGYVVQNCVGWLWRQTVQPSTHWKHFLYSLYHRRERIDDLYLSNICTIDKKGLFSLLGSKREDS